MTLRLIGVPVVISLGVIVVRLIGEIAGAPNSWFSAWDQAPGRPLVSVIGITWLALPVGAHLAWRLVKAGVGPASGGRAVLVGLFAAAFLYGGIAFVRAGVVDFRTFALASLAVTLAGGAAQWLVWPALARTLALYGLLAHSAVAIVMLFAMHGQWGTHFDFQGMVSTVDLVRALTFSLVGQLTGGLAFTILAGGFAGAVTAAAVRLPPPRSASPRPE